ncbi:N-acetylmuramoyl-L-alanine amidase [Streptomyces sp. URMC 123]|uniref:N-acetylmuramoyl-L-alanine amidase n=1 Tax=Streptomyces sp. URMC 123 TaxID=3423403 RepID=UPI003F1C9DAB
MARAAVATAAAALLLPLLPATAPQARAERADRTAPGSLQQAFTAAAAEYGVPSGLLLAVSYLQSRWDTHGGAPSVTGGYGPMHLTDTRTALREAPHHSHGTEDPRGDEARPAPAVHRRLPEPGELPERLRTVERAAALTGLSADALRRDPVANIRGGAALLAEEQRRLGRPLGGDPADWYGAVARYAGAGDPGTAAVYADDVFSVLRSGERRTTDSGQRVVLPPAPGAVPSAAQRRAAGARRADPGPVECPRTLACEWLPAPYQEFEENGQTDYGNHDKADRPRSQKVDYIVIHDTEGSWETAVRLVRDPTYVSWQYTLRSADGHVAQHTALKDVAWHAGNWYVNAKSVGLEHEGFLTAPDAWYTETMYRASARLVRYLADRFAIPLDRQHILGHDNVPGPVPSSVPGMHTDPGPYWDWDHYFALLRAPLNPSAGPRSELITIRPDYDRHRPPYTGCGQGGAACPPHGSGAVRLHTEPRADAPLIRDIGLRPDGSPSTTGVNDTGARASTGQQYAVAERRGDWTAIWYLGQKAWFHNPRWQPTAVGSRGVVASPRPDAGEIPVYGRAYPEAAAYPAGVPAQPLTPLPYRLLPGQSYAVGLETAGEYYWATTFDSAGHRVVRGAQRYYQIQLGHRVAFVRAEDVTVRSVP